MGVGGKPKPGEGWGEGATVTLEPFSREEGLNQVVNVGFRSLIRALGKKES